MIKNFIFITIVLLLVVTTFVFSYLWIDYGLLLMLAETKSVFNQLIPLTQWAKDHRVILSTIYLLLIGLSFLVQLFLLLTNKISTKTLFVTTALCIPMLAFSYNFISYDIFTYMFSAKMVWIYHTNPYIVPPKEFMNIDLWVIFLRNIDWPYRYGWLYLGYSILPLIILGGNKFILYFFTLKLLNAVFFIITGILLYIHLKKDKLVFSIWFFNPLLINEFLINTHNEILMIALFVGSIVYSRKINYKNFLIAIPLFIASVLIKYISIIGMPALLLKGSWQIKFFRALSLALFIYLQLTHFPVQAWYYTWFYMFLPFANLNKKSWIAIQTIGFIILTTYLPLIKSNQWDPIIFIFPIQFWIDVLVILVVYFEYPKPFHRYAKILKNLILSHGERALQNPA